MPDQEMLDAILEKEFAFEVKISGTARDLKKLRRIAKVLKIKKSFVVTKNFISEPGFIAAVQL